MSEKQGGERGSEGDGPSFDDRLRAARSRQGLDGSPPNQGQSSDPFGGSPWGIGLRSRCVRAGSPRWRSASGLAGCLIAGSETRPIFLGIFVLLGGAAGVLNVWRVFAPRD